MSNVNIPIRTNALEIMVDCANIGLWEIMIENNTHTLHMDERTSSFLGFPYEKKIMDFSELLEYSHKDDISGIQDAIHFLIQHPNSKKMFEYRIWNKENKKWNWFRSFGTCQETETLGMFCIYGSTIDIQDSPTIQSLIIQKKEASKRTQIMLDEMPMCCNFWSSEQTMIDCNEESLKLFKMNSKEEYLARYVELMPKYQPCGELSSELAMKHMKDAFANGKVTYEWTYKRLDGTLIPTEVTLIRVKYGNGYIVTAYTRDLREHRKMMREIKYRDSLLHMENNVASVLLRSSIDKFERDLWKCMGLMAASVEVDRVYIWKNHDVDGKLYCSQIYEWSEVAEPFSDLQLASNVPYSDFFNLEETLSNGHCVKGLVKNMPQEARTFLSLQGIQSILITPLFMRKKFWGFIGFDNCHSEHEFTDIEESILHSAGLLITHALLRNEMTLKIQEAEKEAKAASAAKSDFLSNMSHEIRTPMNAIIGMNAIAKKTSDINKKNEALDKIEDASNHMLGIINDILDMSKIEANKFELSEVEFNIERVLSQALNVTNHLVEEKKQQLRLTMDKKIPPTLVGDDQRLAQVIVNLLSNAIKFTPEHGSINLNIDLTNEEAALYTIKFEVSDTGIGIPKEHREHLFEKFHQAENNTTRRFGGTGLGLAISKFIIEKMGGTLSMESELGKGSTFSFSLCLKGNYNLSNENTHQAEDTKETIIDSLKGCRILLTEDVDINREIVISMLEPTGATIQCAENGEEVVQIFKESNEKPHLILMDIQMPVMDGYEATRTIRAMTNIPEATNIPIIAVTAGVFQEDIDKCFKAGMNDHIGKPLDIKLLISKIKALLPKN